MDTPEQLLCQLESVPTPDSFRSSSFKFDDPSDFSESMPNFRNTAKKISAGADMRYTAE
jgi:hypothetical protein